jgi:hypothetical protein
MNWYKLYKKSQNLYDHYFERQPVDDYEEYYPPFEEGKSQLSNTQHHYHGRNVIWVAEEGQTLWVESNDIYPIQGNQFDYEKVNALMDRIEDAEDKIYLYAPTGTATKIDESAIAQSRVDPEHDHNPLTTGDEYLDQFLEDDYYGYFDHFKDGSWDQENTEEVKDYNEYLQNVEQLQQAKKDQSGDFGRVIWQIRDGNHRAVGAIEAGETQIPVMIDDNQMDSIRNDDTNKYEYLTKYM